MSPQLSLQAAVPPSGESMDFWSRRSVSCGCRSSYPFMLSPRVVSLMDCWSRRSVSRGCHPSCPLRLSPRVAEPTDFLVSGGRFPAVVPQLSLHAASWVVGFPRLSPQVSRQMSPRVVSQLTARPGGSVSRGCPPSCPPRLSPPSGEAMDFWSQKVGFLRLCPPAVPPCCCLECSSQWIAGSRRLVFLRLSSAAVPPRFSPRVGEPQWTAGPGGWFPAVVPPSCPPMLSPRVASQRIFGPRRSVSRGCQPSCPSMLVPLSGEPKDFWSQGVGFLRLSPQLYLQGCPPEWRAYGLSGPRRSVSRGCPPSCPPRLSPRCGVEPMDLPGPRRSVSRGCPPSCPPKAVPPQVQGVGFPRVAPYGSHDWLEEVGFPRLSRGCCPPAVPPGCPPEWRAYGLPG